MTDLRKAAEQAATDLEELIHWHGMRDSNDKLMPAQNQTPEIKSAMESFEALRQALAQPEQQQKTPLKVLNLTVFTENRLRNGRVYDVETLQAMTNRDILAIPDMGKKALKEVMEALNVYAVNMSQERVDETAKREHEPVAWMTGDGFYEIEPEGIDVVPLYTAPPKREWVGLAKEDMPAGDNPMFDTDEFYAGMAWAQAKLKEKNT